MHEEDKAKGQGHLVDDLKKLKEPIFEGDDAYGWIYRMTRPGTHHEDPRWFDNSFQISTLRTRCLFGWGVMIKLVVLVMFISATNKGTYKKH